MVYETKHCSSEDITKLVLRVKMIYDVLLSSFCRSIHLRQTFLLDVGVFTWNALDQCMCVCLVKKQLRMIEVDRATHVGKTHGNGGPIILDPVI